MPCFFTESLRPTSELRLLEGRGLSRWLRRKLVHNRWPDPTERAAARSDLLRSPAVSCAFLDYSSGVVWFRMV